MLIDKITTLEIQQEVGGEGKNSAVFVVKDTNLDRLHVAKFIDPADLQKLQLPKVRWFDEAKILHRAEHERVIKLYGAGYSSQPPPTKLKRPQQIILTPSSATPEPWLVISMPLYSKGSIAAWLKSQHGATTRQAIRWTQDALLGTGHIHGLGLLHLDVKPTNLLLDEKNRAVLSDFGQAQVMDPKLGAVVPDKGIYGFHFPPEVFSGGASTVMSDIYQVGLTIYRMVNCDDVLQRQWAWVFARNPMPIREAAAKGLFPCRDYFLPHVPVKLKSAIKKAMAYSPKDRYASSFEFSQALGAVTQLLDWRCSLDAGDHVVFESNSKGSLEIVEIYRDGQDYRTRGTKTVSGSPRNQKKWTTGVHKTRQKAEDALRRVFREEA